MMSKNGRGTEMRAPTPCKARMPRRRFLALTVVGTVGAAWPATGDAAAATTAVQTLASPALLTLIGSERAAHLGQRYRQLVPAENDAQALVAALVPPSDGIGPNLAAELAERVRQDFTHGRTVLVQGWILAVTEARQCALYSLHAARQPTVS